MDKARPACHHPDRPPTLRCGGPYLLAAVAFLCIQSAVSAAEEKTGEVRRFEGHKDFVYCAVFSPDGRQLLSCGGGEYKNGEWLPGEQDHTLWLRDVVSGKTLRRFEGHTGHVASVTFSADGRRALSGSLDGTLRLWEVATGNSIGVFEGHSDSVYGVALAKDSHRAVSGSTDGTVRVWDVDSGKELHKLEGHNTWIWTVALSPDGKLALSGGKDKVCRLWDVENGMELRQFEGHTSDVRKVLFSPDGKRAVSAGFDGTLRLWDVDSGKEIRKFEGHDGEVQGVSFTPDGRRIVSTGFDGTLRLWDVESAKELSRFEHPAGPLHHVVVSADGRYALTTGFDHSLRMWRLPQADKVRPAPAEADKKKETEKKKLEKKEPEKPGEVRRFEGHKDSVQCAAFSPDGRQLVAAGGGQFKNGQLTPGEQDYVVRLWDVASGKCTQSFEGHTGTVGALAFSADGSRVLSSSLDGDAPAVGSEDGRFSGPLRSERSHFRQRHLKGQPACGRWL